MSVYTPVSQTDLEHFLQDFSVGALLHFEGIGAGIENTNYFVTTEQGQFVLTLFEQMEAKEAQYYLDLMAFLANKNIPCAKPLANQSGQHLNALCQRPAALVQRLSGKHIDTPDIQHCQRIGEALAQLHCAALDYPQPKANNRSQQWWKDTLNALTPKLDATTLRALRDEIQFHEAHTHDTLPRGIIHADLFRDNALFDGHNVSGLIDFYYACHDTLLLDIAVTANDWCNNAQGQPVDEKVDALLSGYQMHRCLTEEEVDAWPAVVRAAALRFWLSRLYDLHFPREGQLTHTKDPAYFENLLNHYKHTHYERA